VGGGNVAIDVARAAVRLVQESVDTSNAADETGAESLQPALDAARMAMRSGAEQVNLVSLEARQQMPAWKGEVDEAEHEGIVVDNGWGPKEIVGHDGIVTGLKVRRCLTVFDENADSILRLARKRRSFRVTAWFWPSVSKPTYRS